MVTGSGYVIMISNNSRILKLYFLKRNGDRSFGQFSDVNTSRLNFDYFKRDFCHDGAGTRYGEKIPVGKNG